MLPSTKLYKLDLQFIADNCLTKKIWGKKWLIFQYDKISAEMYIESIDVKDNKLRLSIRLNTKDKGPYINSSYFRNGDVTIPLDRKQQNMDNALRQIVSAIRQNVLQYEMDIARKYVGYKRASEYDDYVSEETERRANEILDAENINNDEIREAYVDACMSKVECNRASEFLHESKYVTRPHYYLMLAAYFYPGDDVKYQKALNNTQTNLETKKYSEYKENMIEYIKAVYEDNVDEFISEMDMDFDSIFEEA